MRGLDKHDKHDSCHEMASVTHNNDMTAAGDFACFGLPCRRPSNYINIIHVLRPALVTYQQIGMLVASGIHVYAFSVRVGSDL
jgi:hypothetical protein